GSVPPNNSTPAIPSAIPNRSREVVMREADASRWRDASPDECGDCSICGNDDRENWRGPGGFCRRAPLQRISRPVSRVLYGLRREPQTCRPLLLYAGCPALQATYPNG